MDRQRQLTGERLTRNDALKMVRRRTKAAGIQTKITPHSFRATGITLYLEDGATLEEAQQCAAHSDPKTTRLCDHSSDRTPLDAINRIAL